LELALARSALYIPGVQMSNDDTRLKKLKFRAWHRGFREADLILGPFADSHVSELSAEELDVFEAILEVPDHDLYEWILERTPTPGEWDGSVMRRLKQFRYDAFEARGGPHGG
jgi:antitoxin CptB